MKKFIAIIATIFLLVGLSITLAGCDDHDDDHAEPTLETPTNLTIKVEGRLVTVTWDAVPGASGYLIYTTSEDCGSGNRIVNTVTKTATKHNGDTVKSAVNEEGITNEDPGFVTFTSDTSFTIWLMAANDDSPHNGNGDSHHDSGGDDHDNGGGHDSGGDTQHGEAAEESNVPMPTALTAKILTIYQSDYSPVTRIDKDDFVAKIVLNPEDFC